MPKHLIKIETDADGRLSRVRDVAVEEAAFLKTFLNETSSCGAISDAGQALRDVVTILSALGVEKEKIVDLIVNRLKTFPHLL